MSSEIPEKSKAGTGFSEMKAHLGKGAPVIISGALLLVIDFIIFWILTQIETDTKEGTTVHAICQTLHGFKDHAYFIAVVLILIGILTSTISYAAKSALSHYNPIVKEELESFRKTLSGEFKNVNLAEIISRLTPLEAHNLMKPLLDKAYGPHVYKKEGLWVDFLSRFERYLKEDFAHVSHHIRTIDINELPDGQKKWRETTSYAVRANSDSGEDVKFPIRYRSKNLLDKSRPNPLEDYLLCITVGNDKILDLGEDAEYRNGELISKKPEFLKIARVDDVFIVDFEKAVSVDGSPLTVTVHEESRLIESDKTISLVCHVPFHGATISVTLPEGFRFVEKNFNRYGEREKHLLTWNVSEPSPSRLHAYSSRWVPPGQCCVLRYEKITQTFEAAGIDDVAGVAELLDKAESVGKDAAALAAEVPPQEAGAGAVVVVAPVLPEGNSTLNGGPVRQG